SETGPAASHHSAAAHSSGRLRPGSAAAALSLVRLLVLTSSNIAEAASPRRGNGRYRTRGQGSAGNRRTGRATADRPTRYSPASVRGYNNCPRNSGRPDRWEMAAPQALQPP